jgi:hypothetical protein
VILGVVALVTAFGVSVSAAQDAEPSLVTAQASLGALALANDGPSEEVLELVAQIEERDAHIAVLQEQLAYVRQAQLSTEALADQRSNEVLALESSGASLEQINAEGLGLWRAGYVLGGGKQLSSFERVILPCESGGQPSPDAAVGPTDDWGRAQINRPTWKKRFEALTGANFEENITDPVLNGFMAAHVEQEQGLSAWTCWRKR